MFRDKAIKLKYFPILMNDDGEVMNVIHFSKSFFFFKYCCERFLEAFQKMFFVWLIYRLEMFLSLLNTIV